MSVLSSHTVLGNTVVSERKCAGSIVYQVDGPDKTTFHWRRNKVNSLDIEKSATPFAMDRQFEDQRILMETNRNPRYLLTELLLICLLAYLPTPLDIIYLPKLIKCGVNRLLKNKDCHVQWL